MNATVRQMIKALEVRHLLRGDVAVGSIAAILGLAIFRIDIELPLGVAAAVPYIAVIMIGWWLSRPRLVWVIAAACSVLTVAGYYLSPPGGVFWFVLANRSISLFAIWITALLVVKARSASLSLRAAKNTLEQRVQQRTAALEQEIVERREIEAVLRHSEHRLAEILDIAADAIISADSKGRIQLFNKGAERIFGYAADEVAGRSFEMLMPARYREIHKQHVEDFARSPQRSRLMGERSTIFGLRKGGTEFPARAALSKIEVNGDALFTLMVQDITDIKQVEATLRANQKALEERVVDLEDARERLERQAEALVQLTEDLQRARMEADTANRAKSEFLAVMSHELRTPLNAIIGFSEVIGTGVFGPVGNSKYLDYVKDIHASGKHLLDLINDILDLSKVESGADVLHDETFEIREIVASVVAMVKGRAYAGGVGLEIEIADGMPRLRADKRKLKQILVNLMTNAVKFTDRGGKVTLKIGCDTEGGLEFHVADTGIGIAREDIPRALSRFGQVGNHAERHEEGTGLGLPLTKALAEQHGGSLDLRSELGIGTTVTVHFPPERSVYERSDQSDRIAARANLA